MKPALAVASTWLLLASAALAAAELPSRPNILWITSEDNGPDLGCYGDRYATTPELDRLASGGVIYRNAWSNAPVCAPARTTIISGMYPPSTGSEHMRSMTRLPAGMKMYPQILREAGYWCTNHRKEDYNLEKTGVLWDGGGARSHWRYRKAGQPFFAIFNLTTTHESQIRKRPHRFVHDPASVRIPAYHPDTPEVRKDWAQYHDKMTEMDAQAGRLLDELDEAGLAAETIVFYYGDHGPGMPRSKRWPYDSGLRVPMVVRIPQKFHSLAAPGWKEGGSSDRLVSFVDLAPTVLSLAGVRPPRNMQGHAFLGKFRTADPRYMFGFRGRMDERYDLVRTVRDGRWQYIRNFMPHKIYGQHVSYMFITPTTRVWKKLYDEGKLSPPRTYFWEPKPAEELYDLRADPDEVQNLAGSAEHREVLERLRGALRDWQREIRDVGLLPEGEIHSRSKGSSPYEVGHDDARYPFERVLAAAELAAAWNQDAVAALIEKLGDPDSAVRYWAATGLLARGKPAVAKALEPLRTARRDTSPYVRIIAAEALALHGPKEDLEPGLKLLLAESDARASGTFPATLALNAIGDLGEKAAPLLERIRKLPRRGADVHRRMSGYVGRLIQTLLEDLSRK